MKKTVLFFLAGFYFVFPVSAQTSQGVKTADSPVQVTVNINNTTSAQGNTQTTTIDNTQNQSGASATAVSQKGLDTANPSAGTSLFGNYASSPYQSDIRVEMLRNTVWGSLVPRKKLYQDPAKGKYPARYYSGAGSAKAQSAKVRSTAAQPVNAQLNDTQTPKANSAAQKTILVEQKDGQLCIPLAQFEQKPEQNPTPGASGSNSSVFYTPSSPSPVSGMTDTNLTNRNMRNMGSASSASTVSPANTNAVTGPASNASLFGTAQNISGQNSSASNPLAQDPLVPQVPAGK